MSKKHFIALADSMKTFFETNAGAEMDVMARNVLINHLADFCQSQNPNFEYSWLHIAQGVTGTSKFRGTHEQFIETINKWNGQQPGVWQYWY